MEHTYSSPDHLCQPKYHFTPHFVLCITTCYRFLHENLKRPGSKNCSKLSTITASLSVINVTRIIHVFKNWCLRDKASFTFEYEMVMKADPCWTEIRKLTSNLVEEGNNRVTVKTVQVYLYQCKYNASVIQSLHWVSELSFWQSLTCLTLKLVLLTYQSLQVNINVG